ncbi:MAG TPA: glycosyltransferase family 39 protein [Pirellulales bacterium]|nr:glycosyltransferase family 39 protein [Pirellulales bacterium]
MPLTPYRHGLILALLLAIAFAARVAAGVWWQSRLPQGTRFAFGDSQTYWTLGQQLAHGEPYQYGSANASVFRMPGYPLLLAALFRVVGDDPPVVWARGLGALLGTMAVGCVYWLGRQVLEPPTALLAAGMAAIYPGAVATSVFVLSEAAFCPLMVAQLAAWVATWQASDPRRARTWAAGAGVLAALATLVRPSWLTFVPFGIVVAMFIDRPRSRLLRLGLVMLAGMAVTMSPWWIRNWRLVGRFVPTTLQMGASLYDGLNPRADGSSQMSFVPEFDALEREQHGAGVGFEYRLDRRLFRASLAWAAGHPRRVIELAGVKFVRLWNVWPNDAGNRGWAIRLVTLLSYVPILGLGLAGVWHQRGRGWPIALCWLPAVYLTLLHVVFVSSIRYREPAMLVLLVPAAAFLRSGLTKRRKDSA